MFALVYFRIRAEGIGLSTVTLDERGLETFGLPRKTCYQIIS